MTVLLEYLPQVYVLLEYFSWTLHLINGFTNLNRLLSTLEQSYSISEDVLY